MTAVLLPTVSGITPTPGTVLSLFSVGWTGIRLRHWFDPVHLASTGMPLLSRAGRHS